MDSKTKKLKEVLLKAIDSVYLTAWIRTAIRDKKNKQKNIAFNYRILILSKKDVDWSIINSDIILRWSESGLKRIKKIAHQGKCYE